MPSPKPGSAPAEHRAREIQLRACVRIGELSRELEQAPTRTPIGSQQREVISKSEALADAKISTSAAHRYEELAACFPSVAS